MQSISLDQSNTSDRLNLFLEEAGFFFDPAEVAFRIFELAGSTQVFPVAGWEDVTSGDGRAGKGHFWAYDDGGAAGWTPTGPLTAGNYRIDWQWKVTASSSYEQRSEKFEVVAAGLDPPAGLYLSIGEVRNAGLAEASYGNELVLTTIQDWQAALDRACRQWFRPVLLTLRPDGNDAHTLFFGVPIVGIDYLRLNDGGRDESTDNYVVYAAKRYPDDRRNPRIALMRDGDSIFTRPISGRWRFVRGRKNQTLRGAFGFVEEDGSVPRLITRAMLKLVAKKLASPVDGTGAVAAPSVVGPIIEEKTDNHSRKYGWASGSVAKRRPGLSGITDDQEVLDIIKLYRAPLGIATPVNWRV